MTIAGFTLAEPGQPRSTDLLAEMTALAVGAVAPEAVAPPEG